MKNPDQFASIQEPLSSASAVHIFLPQNPNFDQVAAGLALFLSLEKAGKKTVIACSKEMTVEYSCLVGVDRIKTKLEGQNLVISFNYLEDSVEKVSYMIEGAKFNVVVQTKEGFSPLTPNGVAYSYSGGADGLVITFGSRKEDLGQLFTDNRQLFDQGKVASFEENQAVAFCEQVANFIASSNYPVDTDIATNLITGLDTATGGFASAEVSADTFEAAAFCLRSGGKRAMMKKAFAEKNEKAESAVAEDANQAGEIVPATPEPDWFKPKIYRGTSSI